jgi:putative transposase
VRDDPHFLIVCRYVERNALRARLVERAEQWRWSSLWGGSTGIDCRHCSQWERPRDWIEFVNEPQTDAELDALRQSVSKERPFGQEDWENRMVTALALDHTPHEPGRPSKAAAALVEVSQ